MKRFIIICLSLVLCLGVSAQDMVVFDKAVKDLIQYRSLPDNELLVRTALHFLGTPYVAGTLEEIPERLVINLHQTDCILFVEMCMGFVQVMKLPNPSYEAYCDIIQKMRYRDGVVVGYDSRLHYTSEWILQNQKNGILEEITARYGKPLSQKFSFMSSHPQSYVQLRDSHDMTLKIKKVEKGLNSQGPYSYIPNDMLGKCIADIKNGDIICFVTPIEGLDISHVAIAYHHDGKLHFIHASSKEKKVVIEKKTLLEYTKNGIRLLRLR